MKKLPFKTSAPLTLGTELEIQLINPASYDLISSAKDLIRNISQSSYQDRIKPEITQSMIEINSSIHKNVYTLHEELLEIQNFLLSLGDELHIDFCGGGTHPFQKWSLTKIFPTKRFKNLSRQYRYLSKRATVFGLHVHIGCANSDDALYLSHALMRYVPQFIALSASSPFYQGIDTGYHSSRLTTFIGYPTSGVMPYFANWNEFSQYYYKMRKFGVISSMKDFYWDIRPKPEFGTVELRICDMPLTISKVVLITAYMQMLALYILKERPIKLTQDLYYLYNYHRFQASRYGFDGEIIDPYTMKRTTVKADILETVHQIEEYTSESGNNEWIKQLTNRANKDDATKLREILKQSGSYPKLVHEQCLIWRRK